MIKYVNGKPQHLTKEDKEFLERIEKEEENDVGNDIFADIVARNLLSLMQGGKGRGEDILFLQKWIAEREGVAPIEEKAHDD